MHKSPRRYLNIQNKKLWPKLQIDRTGNQTSDAACSCDSDNCIVDSSFNLSGKPDSAAQQMANIRSTPG